MTTFTILSRPMAKEKTHKIPTAPKIKYSRLYIIASQRTKSCFRAINSYKDNNFIVLVLKFHGHVKQKVIYPA